MMKYLIINVSEINLIDFETIQQTSAEKLRKSIDGQKTVVKWLGATPGWVNNLTVKEGPYNESEVLVIMATPYWWFVDGGEG